MALVDIRLSEMLREHLDGIPLDLASSMLPRRSWLRAGLAIHLHTHAKAEQRHDAKGFHASASSREVKVSALGLRGILDSLASTVRSLHVRPKRSEWSDYYKDNTYSDDSAMHKAEVVGEFIRSVQPKSLWDLGANTGRFSEIALEHAKTVVAMEQDPWCVEAAYRKWKEEERAILPMKIDLANPSPALGWAHRERQSVVERGPADAVLALALIHHLCISSNVPLPDAASFFASIARHLIIEFVPKEDEMVQFLLRSREDIFMSYTKEGFEAAFTTYFEIVENVTAPDSERVLYLMKAK